MINNLFITTVTNEISDGLSNILNNLKNNNIGIPYNSSCTKQGFQTDNLMDNETVKPYLNKILSMLPSKDFKHRWFHMIDYDINGIQEEHNHIETEIYSYIIYLESSNSGETYFNLNNSKMFVKPVKNMIVFFPSWLKHGGLKVLDNKKVAVGALIKKD
jgi:hypothetical protein